MDGASSSSMEEGNSSPDSITFTLGKRKRSPPSNHPLVGGDKLDQIHTDPSFGHHTSERGQDSGSDSQKRAKLQNHDTSSPRLRQQIAPGENAQRDGSIFPPEIWQHIFTFLPPESLGRLLSVNRRFNSLLDVRTVLTAPQIHRLGHLRLRSQISIWLCVRRSFYPGMPRSLFSMPDPDLWKLLRGRKCQFCGRPDAPGLPGSTTTPWNSGPGPERVRLVWAFAIRSCSSCLRSRLVKVGGACLFLHF